MSNNNRIQIGTTQRTGYCMDRQGHQWEHLDMMEGKEKREKLRVEIRRKNIEQHCRRIRKEWQDYDDDYRQLMIMSKKAGKQEQEGKQLQDIDKQKQKQVNFYNKEYNQSKNRNVDAGGWDSRVKGVLQKLQYLSITNAEQLVQTQHLLYIKQIANMMCMSQDNFRHVSSTEIQQIADVLVRVLTKICVHHQYLQKDTINLLFSIFQLLLKCPQQLPLALQYVIEFLSMVSSCAYYQHKVIIYQLTLSSDVFNSTPLNNSRHVVNRHKCAQNLVKIVQNFVAVPPLIRNTTQCLQNGHLTGSGKGEYWIGKILGILSSSVSLVNLMGGQSCASISLQILQQIYLLLTRLQFTQLNAALHALSASKWIIIFQLFCTLNSSNRNNSSYSEDNKQRGQDAVNNMSIKTRLKMFRVSEIILASPQIISYSLQNQQRTQADVREIVSQAKQRTRSYLYTFLPSMLDIIVPDLYACFNAKTNTPASKPSRAAFQLYSNYETQLLITLRWMLTITDQLDCLPALEYINVKYSTLFADIFNSYFGGQQKTIKMGRRQLVLKCILQKYVQHSPASCCVSWVTQYLEATLCQLQLCFRNEQVIERTIKMMASNVHHGNDHGGSCLLLVSISKNEVIKKLECLLQLFQRSELRRQKSPAWDYKELISNIQYLLQIGQIQYKTQCP